MASVVKAGGDAGIGRSYVVCREKRGEVKNLKPPGRGENAAGGRRLCRVAERKGRGGGRKKRHLLVQRTLGKRIKLGKREIRNEKHIREKLLGVNKENPNSPGSTKKGRENAGKPPILVSQSRKKEKMQRKTG